MNHLALRKLLEKFLSPMMPAFSRLTKKDVLTEDLYQAEMLILDAKKNLEHAEFHLNYLTQQRDRLKVDLRESKLEEVDLSKLDYLNLPQTEAMLYLAKTNAQIPTSGLASLQQTKSHTYEQQTT